MPTLSEYLAQMRSSDAALLFLSVTIALCVVATIYLWYRVKWFHYFAEIVSIMLIPITAFIAGGLSVWGRSLVAFYAAIDSREIKVTVKQERALIAILALALLLRIPRLFDAMWYDEAMTARVASLPLEQLPNAIALDTHPPLHYALIWAWAHIVGPHDWALRIPDLVFGMIGVYLIYRLAKLTVRRMAIQDNPELSIQMMVEQKWAEAQNVGLIAALLMAMLPGAIYYANELRPYSMLTVFVFGALICLFEYRPRLLVLMLIGIVLSHNLGWFYFAVIVGAALLHYRRHMVGYMAAATLISIPFLIFGLWQSHRLTDGFWITNNPGQFLRALLLPIGTVPDGWIVPVILPWIAILMLSLWVARRWIRQPGGLIVMAVALGVPSLVIFTSAIWTPMFIPRPMLPCLLLLLIPLAYGVVVAPSSHLVRAVLAPVLVLALIIFYTPYAARADYRTAIATGCAGAQTLYATEIATGFIDAPYWDGDLLFWSGSEDNGQTFTIDDMAGFNFRVGNIDELTGPVCVLFIDSPYTPPAERVYLDELRSRYPYRETFHQVVNRIQELRVYVFD